VPPTKRILLADDDSRGTELLLAAIGELRLKDSVEVVEDGQQAIDYLLRCGGFQNRAGGNPSLIVSDIKMPKMTGLDLLREVKSLDQLRQIPVVMFTSSQEPSDLVAAYEYGANAYVVKPVDFPGFVKAFKQMIEFWMRLNVSPELDAPDDSEAGP
jgi:CheY-like chemotaxis protein